jgi:hypothetical protein
VFGGLRCGGGGHDVQLGGRLLGSFGLGAIRTGRRNNETSPEGKPATTSASASRHESPLRDFLPGLRVVGRGLLCSGFLNVFVFVFHSLSPLGRG